MNVYKIELLVLDIDEVGIEDVKTALENQEHLCCSVMSIETREVNWSDEHPLNIITTQETAYTALFNKE